MKQGKAKLTNRTRKLTRVALVFLASFILVSLGTQPEAFADPDYGDGPILYGFDPVIHAVQDPRLLGVDRLVLLRRLEILGVDPIRKPKTTPGLSSLYYKFLVEKSGADLDRREYLVEYNGPLGVMTEFEYPTFFYLFPVAESLPGGYVYYPPRPVGDPVVKVFIDDLKLGAARRNAVNQTMVRNKLLDIAGSGKARQDSDGLINLTIPIKLPRTLEKIIGRGEKTQIKITGREHISITGESTVVDPFVPTERVTSQSLFPSLDMEQELQINLSGTIGEKIVIEVDHNSTQIGPDATKIRLAYIGDEDEIIKTIETGDVGLTLPGSQLLGYNSNKSGLFGVKVTGQLGRADFTAVVSKQKAESSAKSFNAKGGQVTEHEILSSNYLNNRFFRLDLPSEPSGRVAGDKILTNTIKIFRFIGGGLETVGDVKNVAAYVDSSGYRVWDFQDFSKPHTAGFLWREVTNFTAIVNIDGDFEMIDLGSGALDNDFLAVTYTIENAQGQLISVGDDPETVTPTQLITGLEGPHYRMKLLKGASTDTHPHVFDYVYRNIYSLGGTDIDPATFDLRIEEIPLSDFPDLDELGNSYLKVFGLDTKNDNGEDGADGLPDIGDQLLFDFGRGLLKFPLDFEQPFAATPAQYEANLPGYVYDPASYLGTNQAPLLYNVKTLPSNYADYAKFKFVSIHASASSSFNLNASNIQEDSEVVTINGRTLVRNVDYSIDYLFGDLELKGEAANLAPDDKVSVTYSFSPFVGGGNTSLMGLSLGYDLGRESKFATTWLYESSAIVGEKPKLGEEPSRNLVGSMNLAHNMRLPLLSGAANLLSYKKNNDHDTTLKFTGEMAMSLPNPNTKGRVFLEDFEGVDSSDIVGLNRISWAWAAEPGVVDGVAYDPANRVKHVRWFLPQERSLRRHLNPDLVNQERDETQPTMDLYLRTDETAWGQQNWGGITRGISKSGLDLSKAQFVEIWVNDGEPNKALRTGKIHLDFGFINEDGFWPEVNGQIEVGTNQREDGIVDGNRDGVWTFEEDIGLDGRGESGPQRFIADFEVAGDSPYPFINGTARNNREDSEDLNRDSIIDKRNGYFTTVIDLKDTEAIVDVVEDYDDVSDLVAEGISWRKYRIPIGAVLPVVGELDPQINAVKHVRIWYEDDSAAATNDVHLQFSEFRFLGSRWEREGVRRIEGEKLLSSADLIPGEEFFLGEVNNKENPGYSPSFGVEEINGIPEKEQSLVLNFQNIERGHMVRASKQVSSQGDDYTAYETISWYWNNLDFNNADLDLFFRVGADTLNYYEVNYRYADSDQKVGWHQISLDVAELSNAKNGVPDDEGILRSTIRDVRSGDSYEVKVRGRPDLRRVKRYYFGLANNTQNMPVSGGVYLNDVKLEGVKRDLGLAQSVGMRLDVADLIKVDFDWKSTDAEYHGLDRQTGSGVNAKNWRFGSNLNIDDFVPLLGYKMPLSVGRDQTINRPKYETNSDVEILDEDVRNANSNISTSKRFSTQLRRSPSQSAIMRYAIDPWTVRVSGSMADTKGPLNHSDAKNLAAGINYDLRLNGSYKLEKFPLLKRIPIVRNLSYMPKLVALSSNFSSVHNRRWIVSESGDLLPQSNTKTRPLAMAASVDYQPLPILDLSVGGNSSRNLLREQEKFGVNIGEETRRAYDLRMTIVAPKARDLPSQKLFAPLRLVAKGFGKLRSSIQFTGRFVDEHDPANRSPGDPSNIRSVSSGGKWDLRMDFPLNDIFKAVFPERRSSRVNLDKQVAAQAAREAQEARRGGGSRGSDPAPPKGPNQPAETPPIDDGLTPDEREDREYERLLQASEDQQEADRERGLASAAAEEAPSEGGELNPLAIFNPVLNVFRKSTPIKFTYTLSKNSSYGRLTDTASFWYKTGLVSLLDVDEDQYSIFSLDDAKTLAISTTTRITKTVALDVKFSNRLVLRNRIGEVSEDYQQDWPNSQLSVSGLEKWGVFGGDSTNRDAGWFQSSNLSLSYKYAKNVSGMTEVSYNPKRLTTISPRWTMNFRSGMTATLNATLSNDNSESNGTVTTVKKGRYELNLKHSFRADSFLAKIGLYRPGSSQSVKMDVSMSYQNNNTNRLAASGAVTAPTGNVRMSLNPRFSVQVTRNLNAALRFIFSRNNNIATSQTTTSLGMGVEATFVF
ncbi:MAG: hypothetical protein ACI9UK_000440 [Candidatus Krumholzibacteriia bacterium]